MPNDTDKGHEAFWDVRAVPQETEQLNEKTVDCSLFVCRAASYWELFSVYVSIESEMTDMTSECIRYKCLHNFQFRIFQKSYLCIY